MSITLLGPDNQPMALAELPHVLELLRQAADAACERATEADISDAFNRGDLGCSIAEHFENSDGRHGWRVWVDEAAPEAYVLRGFICRDLAEHGWPGVEVVTEW